MSRTVGHSGRDFGVELPALPSVGEVAAPRADIARRIAWGLLAVLAVTVAGFAVFDKPPTPVVGTGIYGLAGSGGACTEQALSAGRWSCVTWTPTVGGIAVLRAVPYRGACTHVRVDQRLGRWVCVKA